MNAFYRNAIDSYYATLQELRAKGGVGEQHLRPAFQTLLSHICKKVNWTLLPEQRLANGKVPDGTLRDEFLLPRGYWEAKDTGDDLPSEIKKKIALGYPLTNIIFEDTHRAVLYQNGDLVLAIDLSDAENLAFLLQTFSSHAEPDIVKFEEAVTEFKARIPELAQGVLQIIANERKGNTRFIEAFSAFHDLCCHTLDPRITPSQIDEMLVQHLLTERLFRTVFDNPDFTRRNAIAAEIEQVIDALTSRSFNRGAFLKRLDRFYIAIEDTARGLSDFSEKQHFLNVVYERFFQGFSVKQADTMGIVYTPQEIVDFMCASVEEVLQREFGKSLSTPGVKILDPCVGTGNFIVNILRRINRRDLKKKYASDLFCNEIMLLPYYIASMNIEHEYYQLTGEYAPFDGICFTDTLELAEGKQTSFVFSEENTERVKREIGAEITVILGNPPYNVGQQNENDNNKNRRYQVVDEQIRATYAKDSRATLKTQLYDAYVKFFRWATNRLAGRNGIVCFVSNNSFVDQIAFDGMRKHLLQDFSSVYHLDLNGNVRQNPKISGSKHNVFGIQVGVGITIAIHNTSKDQRGLHFFRVPDMWTRGDKLAFLHLKNNVDHIEWQHLHPDAKQVWRTHGMQVDFETFMPLGTKEGKSASAANVQTIFQRYGGGVKTNRDEWVYGWRRTDLSKKIQLLIEHYNAEVDRWLRRVDRDARIDDFVSNDEAHIKWSGDLKNEVVKGNYATFDQAKIRRALYRPFNARFLYFDRQINNSIYLNNYFFPKPAAENENQVIVLSDHGHRAAFSVVMSELIPDIHLLAAVDVFQCFPFYSYSEDGSNRTENISDWALSQFRAQYGEGVSKWDIFYYIYALLHHPEYRERYAANLKRALPHIPLAVSLADFPVYVATGRKLADLHLHYDAVDEFPLNWIENNKIPFSWRVEKMCLSKDKSTLVVNDSLTLQGFPEECFDYRLGNRSALEWVIDQYQVSTDKRSGLTGDPNREDDPEYIIRLVGRVVTVSVETMKLIRALPELGIVSD